MRPLALLALLAGCTYTPPATTVAPPRQGTDVRAPFERTWKAVVGIFAERNLPIKTLDHSSGFVATDIMRVGEVDGAIWADCGTSGDNRLPADRGEFNVLVRGDSLAANVKVSARWTGYFEDAMIPANSRRVDCVTKGVWEQDIEAAIKARAESTAGVAR